MRRARILLVIVGVVAASSMMLPGHVENLIIVGGSNIVAIAWPQGATITYYHNNQTGPGLVNMSVGSTPVAAIDNAMQTIGAASGLTFVSGGTTGITDVGVDGTNLVTFANTTANQAAVGGAVAVAIFTYSTTTGIISESDIVFNPSQGFSTTGLGSAQDVESVAAHECGHFVGQEHTPCMHATMFPFNGNGNTFNRTLAADDIAGLRTLYPGSWPAQLGTISGTVQRGPGQPVFGGHVVVQDAITGECVTGGVTLADGTFSITSIRPGVFNLFVEPLDGPFPANGLAGAYWNPVAYDTTFRTTILGGASNPRAVGLKAGQTKNVGTITVAGPTPTVSPAFISLTNSPGGFSSGAGLAATAAAGYSQYIAIGGPGMNTYPDSAFSFEGPFLSITGPSTSSGVAGPGLAFKIFPMSIASNTPEGGYSIRITYNGETAFLTGVIDVTQPSPQAWAQPYLSSCSGSMGPVTLSASGNPTLGNLGFSMNVSGTVGGNTGYLFLSLVPDASSLPGSTCQAGLDINNLLVPFPGQAYALSVGTTSLPAPIPNDPALMGLTFYAQFAAEDVGAPMFNLGVSNPLALHVR